MRKIQLYFVISAIITSVLVIVFSLLFNPGSGDTFVFSTSLQVVIIWLLIVSVLSSRKE